MKTSIKIKMRSTNLIKYLIKMKLIMIMKMWKMHKLKQKLTKKSKYINQVKHRKHSKIKKLPTEELESAISKKLLEFQFKAVM